MNFFKRFRVFVAIGVNGYESKIERFWEDWSRSIDVDDDFPTFVRRFSIARRDSDAQGSRGGIERKRASE